MKKILLISFTFFAVVAIWYGEARKFYCLGNGKCVTVWKTYNNVCYIIPGKYYGVMKPSRISHIQTMNITDLDIIWKSSPDSIIVNSDDTKLLVKKFSHQIVICKYSSNQKYNDSLFTDFDGHYKRYKKDVDYISLFIQENYALDKKGNKL